MSNEQLSIDYTQKNEISSVVKLSKGIKLEYRIQRLFFAMGYYTKTGIIVKTSLEKGADIITDLDVYGVYIHKNFISKRIWADCKSGKTKPLERISWLKGIRTTIKIDDIIFVKTGVRTAIKQLAHKSGIMILDEAIISKLESDYNVDKNDWSGPWNPLVQQDMIKTLRDIDKESNGICARTAEYISSSYWSIDEYTRVKKCITAIHRLSEYEQISTQETDRKTIRWAILQLIPMFTLATLNICRDLYFLSDAEKENIIRDNLISSEMPMQRQTEIIDAAYKIATGHLRQQYPTIKIPDIDSSIGLVPPPYFAKYLDLVLRVTDNPNQYYDILRLIDYSLQEYAMNSNPVDETAIMHKIPNYEISRIGMKTILHFIVDVCNAPKDLLLALFNPHLSEKKI